jgi:uncharacterized protein (TIGR03067 family)
MNMPRLLSGSILGILILSATFAEEPPHPIENNDNRMDAAITEARSRIDEFLGALKSNNKERYPKFAVKAAVTEGEHVEHLWLSDVTFKDGHFVGKISNQPHVITKVKRGDEYKVAKDKISDWIYADAQKRAMVGGFTDKAMEEPAVDLGEHELIGVWVVEEVDGGTGPRKQPNAAIEFTRDAVFMVQLGDQPARAKMADLAKMNTETAPKEVDFTRQDAIGYGAYQLDGDNLTLSMRNPGEKRPASLKASPGGMVFKLVRQREREAHKTL